MNTRYFVLVTGILFVSCSVSTESPPTALPEPTTPPEPTSTPTEVVATEMPPSPSPSPTDTPPSTPTQIPTDTSPTIEFNITLSENNPALRNGDIGEWDYYWVRESHEVVIDDVFHLFYTGKGEDTIGIGYAVSPDGLAYTKYEANPILSPDGEGFDAIGTHFAVPIVVEDTWMLFYNGSAKGEMRASGAGSGSSIGLTTAPEPTGPWTTGQLVLKAGGPGEWDAGSVIPKSVIVTEDGYRMYYTGGPELMSLERMCGMATSPDGINWSKYDDPSTTEAPFAESDPVLQPGPSGWDRFGVSCSVLKTDEGWEMYYEGWGQWSRLGFASSQDGLHWSKYHENPILQDFRDPFYKSNIHYPSVVKVGSTYYLYFSWSNPTEVYAATGTINQP